MHLAVSVCTTLLDFFMSFAFCFAMYKRLKMPATFLEVQIYCWPVNLIKLMLQVIIFFRYFCHFYCLLVLALLKSGQKCSYQHCAVCNLPHILPRENSKALENKRPYSISSFGTQILKIFINQRHFQTHQAIIKDHHHPSCHLQATNNLWLELASFRTTSFQLFCSLSICPSFKRNAHVPPLCDLDFNNFCSPQTVS